jgi:protein phosphatase
MTSSSNSADTSEYESLENSPVDRPSSTPSVQTHVDLAGKSHPGKVRPNNEDHFLTVRFGRFLERLQTNLPDSAMPASTQEIGYGLAVADGMGGHAAGEVASRLAILTLIDLVLDRPDWILRLEDGAYQAEAVRRAAERYDQINDQLGQQAVVDPDLLGYGTTLTVATSLGQELIVASIGDSRAYRWRQGKLEQLTRDHTVAQALADLGDITQEQVASHRMRHVLTRALGSDTLTVQPDVKRHALADGDGLLLCSDGLTDMVPDEQIARILGQQLPAAMACQQLVDQALTNGGKDNVTVVVAWYRFPHVQGTAARAGDSA